MYVTSHLKTLITFFSTKSSVPELFLHLFMVTFTNFLTKGKFIKSFVTILDCSSFQLYINVTFGMTVTNIMYNLAVNMRSNMRLTIGVCRVPT